MNPDRVSLNLQDNIIDVYHDERFKINRQFVNSKSEKNDSIVSIDSEIRAVITTTPTLHWNYGKSSITIDFIDALEDNIVIVKLTYLSKDLIYVVVRKRYGVKHLIEINGISILLSE